MKTNSQIRQEARKALSGNWGLAICLILIYNVIAVGMNIMLTPLPIIGTIISTLITIPLGWGLLISYLNICRGNLPAISSLFKGYSEFPKVFITILQSNIQISLWSLLLIIPGIIKSYSYAMVPYIIADTDMKNSEAIHASRVMMRGHKMDLFWLDLLFYFLSLLSIILLFIPMLWILPYWYTARAKFYVNICDKPVKENSDIIS